jgi:signal transduction histidine kinase
MKTAGLCGARILGGRNHDADLFLSWRGRHFFIRKMYNKLSEGFLTLPQIITLLALLANLGLATFVLWKQWRSTQARLMATLAVSVFGWGWSLYLFQIVPDPLFAKFAFVFASLIPAILLFFSFNFPRQMEGPRVSALLHRALVVLPTIFAASALTPLLSTSPRLSERGITGDPGPLLPLFMIYFIVYVGWAFGNLVWKYWHAKGIALAQIRYFFVGTFAFALLAIPTNLVLPTLGNYNYNTLGPAFSLIQLGFIAYAIVAHRLFDIRVIIRKTVVYSGLLGFVIGAYSLIIFTLATLFGTETGVSRANFLPNLLAALVVAAGFEPLRRWLVSTTDRYLFVGEYNSSEVIEELSKTLSGVIDLDEALVGMMQTVSRNLRLRSAATFVLRRFKDKIDVKRVKFVGYHRPEILTLETNDPLIAHFEGAPVEPVVTEEFERTLEELPLESRKTATISPVVTKLKDLRAAVALPLVVKDQLIGISLFGEKLSGDYFTEQDLDLLAIVAHETAGAIEKARFYEEDQLKSEFVSIASHELLTPVAGIQGYLSLVLDEGMGKVDSKARGYLVKVRETTGRLTELVNDLLNVSRIEGGRIKITPQEVQIVEVVEAVVDELLPKAKEKNLQLKTSELKTGLPPVWADPERVRQILVNLVGNAIKYSERGGVTISGKKANQSFAEILVKDTGIGIPPQDIPHLFEKFYRVDSEKTAGISGTGLGLYITKNLTEIMGGTIGVESEEGKGSTFWVRLPVAKEA